MTDKPNPSLPRQKGKRQEPAERVKNFDEVAQGFSNEEAALEASRCLNCKNAKCSAACPVNIDIPAFIGMVKNGDTAGAYSKILETNFLPSICGRVCPQENYCENACVLKGKYEPVAIGLLEHYVADFARKNKCDEYKLPSAKSDYKIAVVGSGPAGLTVAAELKRHGHDVTIFEALHEPGGVLIYGIPPFRLPREVVRHQIDIVKKLGVEIVTDAVIGITISMEELLRDFNAVFIGSGVGQPVMMNIPGEDLPGIYSANEFLTRMNLMEGYKFPHKDTPIPSGSNFVIVGGGNSAMDAARCAKRLNPRSVAVLYRRTQAEMPARAEEVENAMEEGIKFEFLAAPVEFFGKEKVERVKCIKMELGEPDSSGRRRPKPKAGSEFYLEADCVIEAIGQDPNPIIQNVTPALLVGRRAVLKVNENFETSMPGVFAGGDIINGGSTVIEAMRDGKAAAASICKYLSSSVIARSAATKQSMKSNRGKPNGAIDCFVAALLAMTEK
ncbi:MAG: NADPH-dependent glutamate synthase [Elusimicrobia bacterium]|nr:NADPH-dependent glutamate synthase [Elusimicrobiota bacterium]